MLRFVVFEKSRPAEHWPLRHVHLFGPDHVSVSGDVRFEAGLIVCEKGTEEATGLSLQYDLSEVGDLSLPADMQAPGILTLETCLLPAREKPYLLSLELARHRIMLFLNKLEEWGLFDLAADDPIMRRFEQARLEFTHALVAHRKDGESGHESFLFCPEADQRAGAALALAIDAGERLAVRQAERNMPSRLAGRFYQQAAEQYFAVHSEHPPAHLPLIVPNNTGVILASPPSVGVGVDPTQFSEPLQRLVTASSDFVSLPMRWADMEPTEGKYAFGNTDRWIEWAIRKAKLPVVAGPLVDFAPRSVPDWLYIWENDYETLRELVHEHVRQIVTRYRRTVHRWTVASGLHLNSNFVLSFEQILDLTRICVALVRKLHPASKIQLEIAQPWGEYYSHNRRALPPTLYAEMVTQAGIAVDAYALRLTFGQSEPGSSARDLAAISSLLDRYAGLEKPIAVSVLGAPSAPAEPVGPAPSESAGARDVPAHEPGHWHRPWTPAVQAEFLAKTIAICCAKPYVTSVCWQDLTDMVQHGQSLSTGLASATGEPKSALVRLAEIKRALREQRNPLEQPLSAAG